MQAAERAKDLAFEGLSASEIKPQLENEGMGWILDEEEIERIVIEVRAAQDLIPKRPSKKWPRIVGFIAILAGIVAFQMDDSGMPSSQRYSPAGFGITSLILGIILVVKPGWASESLK